MSYYSKSLMVLLISLMTTLASAQLANVAEEICPLLIGSTIPDASLKDVNGSLVYLSDVLQDKPTILVFYRGGWCPYCTNQLSSLASVEREIMDMGYQIVAVSPDEFEGIKTTEDNEKVSYTILSDPNGKFIQQMGIGFKTPERTKNYLVTKSKSGQVSEVMPVPSIFILDQSGKILFEYINPDYTVRMSSYMLLAVLKSL